MAQAPTSGSHLMMSPYSPEGIIPQSSIITERLPPELITNVIGKLRISDLRHLRLVSKEMEAISAPVLFASVVLSHSTKSVSRILDLSKHERLREFVYRIDVCNWRLAQDFYTTVLGCLKGDVVQEDLYEEWYQDLLNSSALSEAYCEEVNVSWVFNVTMLDVGPETSANVRHLVTAFAQLPKLREFSLGNLGSVNTARSDADIVRRTGCFQMSQPEPKGMNRDIRADDLALWIRNLQPEVFEVDYGIPWEYNFTGRNNTDHDYLAKVRTFKLIYSLRALRCDGDFSLPSVRILDNMSRSMPSVRDVCFGFDDLPLGPLLGDEHDIRLEMQAKEFVVARVWESDQLEMQRVIMKSFFGQLFPVLDRLTLYNVVTTERQLLGFLDRHVGQLRQLRIENLRVEESPAIQLTMLALVEELRGNQQLERMEFEGDIFDEHGNIVICSHPTAKSLGDPDPALMEMPFSLGGYPFLLAQLENYICHREDDFPLEVLLDDGSEIGFGSLYCRKFIFDKGTTYRM